MLAPTFEGPLTELTSKRRLQLAVTLVTCCPVFILSMNSTCGKILHTAPAPCIAI